MNTQINSMLRRETAGSRLRVPEMRERMEQRMERRMAPPPPPPPPASPYNRGIQNRLDEGKVLPPGWENRMAGQNPGGQPVPLPAPVGRPIPTPPGQMIPAPPAAPGMPRPPRYAIQPPGVAARPEDYSYEPMPDRTWKMYPPGIPAPARGYQVSMPRAASTAELARMSQDLGRYMQQREQIRRSTVAPAIPGFLPPGVNPNEVQGY